MTGRALFLLAFVTYAEQRGLQDVDMALPYKFREELQEKCYHEQAYVHAVHIGISGYYYLVVTQVIQALLYVQGCLQQVELLILINHLLGESVAVKRLTAQAEYGLCVHVTALGDGSAGGVTLSYEYAALLLAVTAGIIQVDAAVGQFAVVQVGLLGALTGLLGDAGNLLTLLL